MDKEMKNNNFDMRQTRLATRRGMFVTNIDTGLQSRPLDGVINTENTGEPPLNPNAESFSSQAGRALSVRAREFFPRNNLLGFYVKKFVSCLNPDHQVHICISTHSRRVATRELAPHFPGVTGEDLLAKCNF